MIVKNEAAVIERCIASVRPFIHSWAIADTGSADGTQERIRRALADLPGALIERPWVDFAHNRNEALDLARAHGDYVLLMDADDVLEHDSGFVLPPLTAPAYSVEFVHGSTRHHRTVFARLDAGWRWKGVLHEALWSAAPRAIEKLAGLRMRISEGDGARSQRPAAEKYADDARVLARALAQEPDNARYAFYLAQSLRDAGRLAEARAAYHHRIGMGGWDQEVYWSHLEVAMLGEREGLPEAEVVQAYLAAYQNRPARAESLCHLARYQRERQRHALALLFARQAAALPRPDDVLFVDASVYDWRARDELSIAAYWCGDRALSARLCRELLDDPRLPAEQRERVRRNLAFSVGEAGA